MRRLLILGLAATLLLLAACGKPQPSGVQGIVLFGGGPGFPSSPLPGGFGTSEDRPYRYVIVQVTATSGPDAGKVMAKLKPDAQALFKADLPPGDYVLRPLVHKNGPWPYGLAKLTVRAGQRARVIVYVTAP